MNEVKEPRLANQPNWLELPEEEKLEHTYWTTFGYVIDPKLNSTNWSNICHSKEEAEAYACREHTNWIWDHKEAKPISLRETMTKARKSNRKGVRIKGYRDGKWVTIKEYPTEVPLV